MTQPIAEIAEEVEMMTQETEQRMDELSRQLTNLRGYL